MKILRNFSCLLLALFAPASLAQEGGGEELVEKVVVRNRLFNVEGRFELGANFGFSMLSRLTDHTNFNLSAGYNFMDSLALELRVGYALSGHTGLANDIQDKFFVQPKTAIVSASDLTDLWEMKFNAVVGLRWQPIYGKLGLMAELPIHFQAYLWVGGGVAMLDRQSVVICNREGMVQNPDTGRNELRCLDYLRDSKVGPLVSLALGFRFFLTDNHVVRFEIRDWSWLDSFVTCADRAAALTPSNPTGNVTTAACPNGNEEHSGITNLVQFDLGYTFIF
jgi:outer membrane beta-barrel protein